MNYIGISAGFHDAAVSVVNQAGDILFAAHSERYSKVKNDRDVCAQLIHDLDQFNPINTVAYYERPAMKQARQWYAGQGIEWNKLSLRRIIHDQIGHACCSYARCSHACSYAICVRYIRA